MNFILSFLFAFNGLKHCIKRERNFFIESAIAVMAICLGIILDLGHMEWSAILICIAMVLCLEMINSAIEHLCNLLTTDYNPAIGKIKDIAAGAVLLASIISLIIGCFIFLPKIYTLSHG